ncbi:hypothetical protein, partial [Pseudomonas syringae]|uniref:hypothetical protein n=1 Tax=Pseudomonas syringae TaxID=317 RepID=UPI001F46FC1D
MGELICEVNEQSLKWVQSAIEKAELTVRQKVNNKTNLLEDAPTRYRCEVSAIGKIDTWEKSD